MLLVMHGLSPLLMIALPLAGGVWLVRRWRLDWAIFGLGAVTFIVSQVFHVPFNHFLLNPLLEDLGGEGWARVAAALLLGLSAGLFEEVARYLMLRRRADRIRRWPEGILFGLGHGGAEAIIVGLLVAYGLFQALALQGIPLESVVPADRLEVTRAQVEAYWGMAWYEPLWATLERVSAMGFHLMAAILVLKAVRQRRLIWLGAAILAHTALNAIALVAVGPLGVAVTEILLLLIGGTCVFLAIRLRREFVDDLARDEKFNGHDRAPPVKAVADNATAERLDESRYL